MKRKELRGTNDLDGNTVIYSGAESNSRAESKTSSRVAGSKI